ncbi:MAG: hypothetical protein AB1813_19840, partial [Verrucomicrobiota bacterium]
MSASAKVVSDGSSHVAVLGVLGIGLVVTTWLAFELAREARITDESRFDRLVHDTTQLLETRVERY